MAHRYCAQTLKLSGTFYFHCETIWLVIWHIIFMIRVVWWKCVCILETSICLHVCCFQLCNALLPTERHHRKQLCRQHMSVDCCVMCDVCRLISKVTR